MVSIEPDTAIDESPATPVVLSHGASIALSSAVNRLLKPERRSSEVRGKRPRAAAASVVLAENEQVAENVAAEQEARRRDREAKRARLRFESNAKVIPDAATDATREKELLATATRGAVALFNAVSKAKRAAKEERAKSKVSKKGNPVSRDSFMSMIRAGVAADPAMPPPEDGDKEKAGWLKDNYVTSKSRKLKDWETAKDDEGNEDESDEDDASEDDSDGNSEDDSEDDSEANGLPDSDVALSGAKKIHSQEDDKEREDNSDSPF